MKAKSIAGACVLFAVAASARGAEDHVLATTRLNLRSCPATKNCTVIETLSPQAEMVVTGQNGDWLSVRVLSGGSAGWVNANYVMHQNISGNQPDSDGLLAKAIHKFFPILLVGGILFGLGYSGLIFRRGFELKKALSEAKSEVEKKGNHVNDRWHSMSRHAIRRMWLPALFWTVVYCSLYIKFSLSDFLFSLIGLVLPVLGYFGFLVGPSFDASDLNLDS